MKKKIPGITGFPQDFLLTRPWNTFFGLKIPDIIIYENLANLNQLPLKDTFMFYGFPLSLKGLDGSPVRAVGIVEN